MGDEDNSFMEKVRNSFSKVKEDIEKHSNELNEVKNAISEQNKDISTIKSDLEEIKALLKVQKSTSTGNEGVGAQWRMMHDAAQRTTMPHDAPKRVQKIPKNPLNLSEFELKLLSLTDREFSVLLAIYDLSQEHGYTTYEQLTERLNVTDSPIRHALLRLIPKGMPIEKERVLNGKASLSIKEGFLTHSLISKIMRLRQDPPTDQKTLFDE